MASKQRTANTTSKAAPHKKDTGSGRRTGIWIFSFVILVVIIVTFIGAPIVSRSAGSGNLVFGSYAGQDIVYSQGNYFDHEKNLIAQRLQDSGQQTNSQNEVYQVWRQAFVDTAFHQAVMIQAHRAGLIVSGSAVDTQIAKDPQFLDQNGQFSVQKYNTTSNGDKFRLRGYLQQQLVQQQYVTDELNGVHLSSKAIDFISSMASPERRFDFVSYSYADFPDSKVIEYGTANEKKFQRISLSVITINSNQGEADAVHQQLLNKTASFADLARAHSSDMYADKGGDMGWTYYYQIATDFADPSVLDKVFQLKAGEYSSVLKTTYGWVIYRVNEPAQKPDFTNKDTVKIVRDYMSSFERGIVEDYLVSEEKAIKTSAETKGFAAAAATAGRSVSLTNYFPINYGNEQLFQQVSAVDPKLSLSAGVSRQDFFTQLFGLTGKQISNPIVLGNNVMIFQLADQRDASQSTISDLKTNLPQTAQQFQAQDVQTAIFESSKLVDNFNQTFAQYVYTAPKK